MTSEVLYNSKSCSKAVPRVGTLGYVSMWTLREFLKVAQSPRWVRQDRVFNYELHSYLITCFSLLSYSYDINLAGFAEFQKFFDQMKTKEDEDERAYKTRVEDLFDRKNLEAGTGVYALAPRRLFGRYLFPGFSDETARSGALLEKETGHVYGILRELAETKADRKSLLDDSVKWLWAAVLMEPLLRITGEEFVTKKEPKLLLHEVVEKTVELLGALEGVVSELEKGEEGSQEEIRKNIDRFKEKWEEREWKVELVVAFKKALAEFGKYDPNYELRGNAAFRLAESEGVAFKFTRPSDEEEKEGVRETAEVKKRRKIIDYVRESLRVKEDMGH